MKNSLSLIFIFYISTVFSQTVQIGDDIFSEGGSAVKDMVVTNSGEVIIAFRAGGTQGYIEVYKYDGVDWVNIANSGQYVDSLCINFKLVYNPTSDTTFLGYTKNDGFYLRSFNSNWSSPEFYSCGVSLSVNDGYMMSAIDKPGNVPYFTHFDDNQDLMMLSFENSTFNEVLVASSGTFGIIHSDLLYNESDGFIYHSYNKVSKGVIERFNGISWSFLDENIPLTIGNYINGSKLFKVDGENEILCLYSYDNGAGTNNQRYGIAKYDCGNNDKNWLLPDQAEYAAVLRGGAYDGTQIFADFNAKAYSCSILEVIWEDELELGLRYDYCLDNQGYLYWNENDGPTEDVYRSGPFVLGEMDLDPELNSLIFPNPAANQIQITSDELNSVSFFSIDGALVAEGYEVSKSQPLNIDFLSKGLYIVKLVGADGEVNQQRIVVE